MSLLDSITSIDGVPINPDGSPKTEPYEQINHPDHYNRHPAGLECIDVIEYMSLNIGTAIKYLWRQGLKPGTNAETDLRKSIWYIEREIARLKGSQPCAS